MDAFRDNGANFRSRQLMTVCGRPGVSPLHARPYHAAGKGRIGRFLRTVRGQVLALPEARDADGLDTLNRRFRTWVEAGYHMRPHRGLGDGRTPLDQWALTCGAVRRPEPGVGPDGMFLSGAVRRVSRARTVSPGGRTHEVDAGMDGAMVTLRHDPSAPPGRPVKVVHGGRPAGLARPPDLHANARIRRGGAGPAVRFRKPGEGEG